MVQNLVFRANRLPGFVQPCCKVSCFILSICKTNDIGTFSIGFGKRSQLSISRKSNRWKLSYSMLKDGQDEAVMRTCPTLLNWCVTEALLQKLRLKKSFEAVGLNRMTAQSCETDTSNSSRNVFSLHIQHQQVISLCTLCYWANRHHVCLFAGGVTRHFEVTEEFGVLQSMQGQTKGSDSSYVLLCSIQKHNLELSLLVMATLYNWLWSVWRMASRFYKLVQNEVIHLLCQETNPAELCDLTL
jgi:hypothetical protein